MSQAISREPSSFGNTRPSSGPSRDQEAFQAGLDRPLSGSRYPVLGAAGARPASPISISSLDSVAGMGQQTPSKPMAAARGPASPVDRPADDPSPPPPSYASRSQSYQLQQMAPAGQRGYAPQPYAQRPYTPQSYAQQPYAQQPYSHEPMAYHADPAAHGHYASHQYQTGYPQNPQMSAGYAPQGNRGYASQYGGAAATGCCTAIPMMAAGCCVGELCTMGSSALTGCNVM